MSAAAAALFSAREAVGDPVQPGDRVVGEQRLLAPG
jgi:hypothetical protein